MYHFHISYMYLKSSIYFPDSEYELLAEHTYSTYNSLIVCNEVSRSAHMAERIDVFISSTSRDLQEYRDAVAKVILRLGMYPIDMATFNPTDRNALQLCYDKVQEAEIFVGIYAYRYGYAPDGSVTCTTTDGEEHQGDGETGITHLEYQWAIERNLPMLLFVVDEDAPWSPKFIEDEPGKSRLKSFKNDIMSKHVVGFFNSPDNLATQVATGLSETGKQFQLGSTPLNQRRDFYKHVQLPPNYVPRNDLIAELRLALLGEDNLAFTSGVKGNTALHGMGGIGKSVMARALCDDSTIKSAFPDGILWTTLGQEPNLTTKLREWVDALGGIISENVPTVDSLKATLAEFLEHRTCLLIVDDVWQKNHAEAFRIGGENCRLLLTTRDAEVARSIGAEVQPIPTMNRDEAVDLLLEWAGANLENTDQNVLHTIINRLGRLPLAIKLAGAQLQRKSPDRWLERFDARKLKSKRAESIHDSLEQTFGLTLETLEETERKLYAALSIFKEDEPIREVAIIRLWSALDDYDEDDTEDLLDDLASRALLEVAGDKFPRAALLHDLLRDFMASELADAKVAHEALLDAYRETQTGDGWHTAPDDGYLYENLCYHLVEVRNYREMRMLFETDNWLKARAINDFFEYDYYVQDIDRVWHHIVSQIFQSKSVSKETQDAFSTFLFRLLIIRSKITSIAVSYSAQYILKAFESKHWSIERVFNVLDHIPHISSRIKILFGLGQSNNLGSYIVQFRDSFNENFDNLFHNETASNVLRGKLKLAYFVHLNYLLCDAEFLSVLSSQQLQMLERATDFHLYGQTNQHIQEEFNAWLAEDLYTLGNSYVIPNKYTRHHLRAIITLSRDLILDFINGTQNYDKQKLDDLIEQERSDVRISLLDQITHEDENFLLGNVLLNLAYELNGKVEAKTVKRILDYLLTNATAIIHGVFSKSDLLINADDFDFGDNFYVNYPQAVNFPRFNKILNAISEEQLNSFAKQAFANFLQLIEDEVFQVFGINYSDANILNVLLSNISDKTLKSIFLNYQSDTNLHDTVSLYHKILQFSGEELTLILYRSFPDYMTIYDKCIFEIAIASKLSNFQDKVDIIVKIVDKIANPHTQLSINQVDNIIYRIIDYINDLNNDILLNILQITLNNPHLYEKNTYWKIIENIDYGKKIPEQQMKQIVQLVLSSKNTKYWFTNRKIFDVLKFIVGNKLVQSRDDIVNFLNFISQNLEDFNYDFQQLEIQLLKELLESIEQDELQELISIKLNEVNKTQNKSKSYDDWVKSLGLSYTNTELDDDISLGQERYSNVENTDSYTINKEAKLNDNNDSITSILSKWHQLRNLTFIDMLRHLLKEEQTILIGTNDETLLVNIETLISIHEDWTF